MSNDPTLHTFLDELASAAPTPGGGGAAALSGAMGAALVSMVCNLTIGKEKFAAVEGRMQEILRQAELLRARLTQMIEDDVVAFDTVMAAYRLPKASDEEKAARTTAIQEASKNATLVPLAAAHACAEVIDLCRPTAEMGNPNVVSDAGVAVLCAQAGLKAAALNVLINLGAIKDEAFVAQHRAELDQLLAGHEVLANEVYELVKGKL
ncbi:MAG: cyclodeaminase/cyclohydrolase family protein [Anaerolineales bacterium]|nr:cyclodeaminase/cyclohydrolase family protein [Anaerolineales bacterium]